MKRKAPIVSLIALILCGTSVQAQQTAPIFDGQSLAGWTTLNGKPVTKGWEVIDGMIHLSKEGGRAGAIVTEQEYGDFELRFEWKNVPGGNNGIKYRVRKYGNKTLGLEYQIIDDDGYKVKLPPTGMTGALYDLYEPNNAKLGKPPGEFNRGRIVVQGDRIEHWLNGFLIVRAYVGSEEWNRRVADSKFADAPEFGENRRGKIMLTDHNSEVWFRNLELTPLTSPAPQPTVICQPECNQLPTSKCVPNRRGILRRLFCRQR